MRGPTFGRGVKPCGSANSNWQRQVATRKHCGESLGNSLLWLSRMTCQLFREIADRIGGKVAQIKGGGHSFQGTSNYNSRHM